MRISFRYFLKEKRVYLNKNKKLIHSIGKNSKYIHWQWQFFPTFQIINELLKKKHSLKP